MTIQGFYDIVRSAVMAWKEVLYQSRALICKDWVSEMKMILDCIISFLKPHLTQINPDIFSSVSLSVA